MERDEWLATRPNFIGSSEAAIACGMSEHKSEYYLWLLKTRRIEPDDLSDNAAVQLGLILEPGVAAFYEQRTGKKLRQDHKIRVHPQHPFMAANLDRVVVGERKIVELKTSGITNKWAISDDEWGPDGSDLVPPAYMFQLQHQMEVTGYRESDLVVLFGGRPPAIYHVPYDPEFAAMMVRLEAQFWQHVQTDTPPTPRSLDDVRARYPFHIDSPIVATSEIEDVIADLRAAQETAKELDAKIDACKARIAEFMGDHDALVDPMGHKLLTFRTQERKAYSVAASSSRVMRLNPKAK